MTSLLKEMELLACACAHVVLCGLGRHGGVIGDWGVRVRGDLKWDEWRWGESDMYLGPGGRTGD